MAVYDGVPSIRLEGDEAKALAAIPAAKVLLQQVQQVLRTSGANTFSGSQKYGDDVSIYVLCANGQNIIHIAAGEPSVPFEFVPPTAPTTGPWPDLLSGIVLDGVIESYGAGTPSSPLVKKLKHFIPTPACARTHELPNGSQTSARLAVSPWTAFGEWRASPPDMRDFSQYQVPRPSWWSGKMKKVVQAVMGFGRINPRFLPPGQFADDVKRDGVQIRFDYKFNRTHGIVEAADNRLWLVEISINRGVIAMPLPIYSASTTEMFREHYERAGDTPMLTVLDDLGCLPTGEGFPAGEALNRAMERGDVIRLATVEHLREFYQSSGFSSICGWAFSESGNEAHNVGYFYADDDPIQRSAWYQLNIAIGATVTNRKPNDPIASGSASLRKQREGRLYSPPAYQGFTPIYYYEPMLSPPGLLRHNAMPSDGIPRNNIDCNAPIYVAIMDGSLKVGSFYCSSKELPPSRSSTLGEDECPYSGSWTTITSSGSAVPMMCYTNDVDNRRPCEFMQSEAKLTSKRLGYTGMQVVEFVDAPGWAYLFRSAVFQQLTVTEFKAGERIGGVFVAPSGSREAYFLLEGTWYARHYGTTSVSYDFVLDPNVGYGWDSRSGPRFLTTSIGVIDAWTCGSTHTDRRIVGAGREPNPAAKCAEYADSGEWLNLCDTINMYLAPDLYMPNIHSQWDKGRDFSGTATLISAGLNGPVTMPLSDTLFALYNDPPSMTGANPPTLSSVHSAIGDRAVVHTGLDGGIDGIRVVGYVPTSSNAISSCPCFIGANHP